MAIALVVGWLAVMAVGSWLLANSEATNRKAVASRLQTRTQFAAGFISLYTRDMLTRQEAQARTWLASKQVGDGTLERVASGLGLRAAALLDDQGQMIATLPSQPAALSRTLLPRYAALSADGAAGARPGASSISVSEISGAPILSFAVAYGSPSGTRVFSGAYDMANTVLPTVLGNLISTPGWQAYLVDASGALLADVRSSHPQAGTLAHADPLLSAADTHSPTGSYDTPQGKQDYFTAAVNGTRWRIVVTDPESQLYGFLDGAGEWLAWLAIAGLTAAGLAIISLIARLQRSRTKLTELNTELARLAAVDALTGLKNRRAIEESLHDALSSARRHESRLSVLVLDIDHFKNFNDTLGHRTGDAILAHTAQVLDGALRAEDSIGRWGGEEFLVVLPGTDEQGALHATERLRAALVRDQPEEARSRDLRVTITIGVAEWREEAVDELVTRADSALYLGKAAGRDTVQVSRPLDGVAVAPGSSESGNRPPHSLI
jgi:diguanylate cyclase (GGDEF)-like protein